MDFTMRIPFRADHPFHFFVETENGTTLFKGRLQQLKDIPL